MPPKKKGGKAEEPDDLGLPADGTLPIRNGEDALRQLKERTLQDRVSSLETQNKVLIKRLHDTKSTLDETESEQGDVYVYLHKKLDENFEVIATLERRVEELETENERMSTTSAKTLADYQEASESKLAELQRQIANLRQDLNALEDFRLQKEMYTAEIERLKKLLEQEKEDRLLEVTELERRSVAAKERLKTEMFNKIKETKKTILMSTKDQLHYTVKRTMAENEQMITELTYQSKETERILELNTRLQKENADLRRSCELLEDSQGELIKRTQFYQKLVKKLNESIARQEEKDRVLSETGVGTAASHQKQVELEQMVLSLKRELATVSDTCRELDRRAVEAVATAAEARAREDALLSLQDDTMKFLLSAVEALRQQVVTSNSSDSAGSEPRLSTLPAQEKLKAVDMLLSRLQVYESAVGSIPRQSVSQPLSSRSMLPRLPSSTTSSHITTSPGKSTLQEALSKGRTLTITSTDKSHVRSKSTTTPSPMTASISPQSKVGFGGDDTGFVVIKQNPNSPAFKPKKTPVIPTTNTILASSPNPSLSVVGRSS